MVNIGLASFRMRAKSENPRLEDSLHHPRSLGIQEGDILSPKVPYTTGADTGFGKGGGGGYVTVKY